MKIVCNLERDKVTQAIFVTVSEPIRLRSGFVLSEIEGRRCVIEANGPSTSLGMVRGMVSAVEPQAEATLQDFRIDGLIDNKAFFMLY